MLRSLVGSEMCIRDRNRFADWYINEKNGELMQSERGHLFSKWLFSSPDRLADLVAEFRGWKDD